MEQQGIQGQKVQSAMASVRYGVYNQPGPYAGKTVADVRSELGTLWSIPGDAQAFKGKEQLDGSYQIQPGDHIEFHRSMGEKGSL